MTARRQSRLVIALGLGAALGAAGTVVGNDETVLPGQVITVSDQISREQRATLLESFTQGDGVKVIAPVVKRFAGKKAKSFVPVIENEYDEYYTYIRGVVLGW